MRTRVPRPLLTPVPLALFCAHILYAFGFGGSGARGPLTDEPDLSFLASSGRTF